MIKKSSDDNEPYWDVGEPNLVDYSHYSVADADEGEMSLVRVDIDPENVDRNDVNKLSGCRSKEEEVEDDDDDVDSIS